MKPEMLDCGHLSTPDGVASGHAINDDGKRICYDCCAEIEKQSMIDTGRATLYLVNVNSTGAGHYEVTNWPGNMRFKVSHHRIGKHNIAGKRIDVYFTGPDRNMWWGVSYGSMTQIVHCKRIKK